MCRLTSKYIKCWSHVRVDDNVDWFVERGIGAGFVRLVGDKVERNFGDEFIEVDEL